MNEWEFTAQAAGWINELISKDPQLPFLNARCEQRSRDSLKRRDLTLLDRNRSVVMTGEIKLPYQKDGGSPLNASVVRDARAKARRAGANFFFTWNVNEFVLWETDSADDSWQGQKYRTWDVTSVHREGHLEQPMTVHAVRGWLDEFLHEFARIVRGAALGRKAPDEKFIEVLESSLRLPILLTLEALAERYQVPRSRSELDRWMREEQGWVIYDDPEGRDDNLERAAKFACYNLVNRLVFHEALLKRYGARLDKLSVPEHIDTGEALRLHLERYFAEAREVTRDYETVFGEDRANIGNRLPFFADGAVVHWRALIEQIHEFDFSRLDYEIIGGLFERLISPDERQKFGQFYTRVEIVDLINSFCITTGTEKVMDPACGGGTFLVRAYARKRELAPARPHRELLTDLFGIDISHFATHLTTINLATRNLIDEENYPQIARSDFFDIRTGSAFLRLPKRVTVKGLGKIQHRDVEIPPLDAVVGNPPYIRQEEIPKDGKKEKGKYKRGTKDYYLQLIREESGARLSGRSDIHCYFWPHGASFLKDKGYLCFLTSSQWLDVEYGFRLQSWILDHFEIVAVFESVDEPWFIGARVTTTVTILRREPERAKRAANMVRFVQLRRPVSEIFAHDGTTIDAFRTADAFRDEILSLMENTVNERYRARLVRQQDLWRDGVRLAAVMKKSGEAGENGDEQAMSGEYYGGKWGVYLRAPDLWFDLLDEFGDRFTPLGEIAEVRFGVKSGKDSFFFPIDCTTEALKIHEHPAQFRNAYDVPREVVEAGDVRLVRCGEERGEIRPLEAKFLEPEVHSLMEVDGFTVAPEDCSRRIILIGKQREELKGTYADRYVAWGEERKIHAGATCAARVTEERAWYDLTGHRRGSLFWSKSQQYKHAVPVNEHDLQCNCNLYDIHLTDATDPFAMAGILNSSWVVLSKFQYGRPVGVEGNLKTEVVDVNMMRIPDPRRAKGNALKRVSAAFGRLKKRKALQFLSERRMREMAWRRAGKEAELEKLSDLCELDMTDRWELDDAVLAMLGVRQAKRREEMIDTLYRYLREFFERTRRKEEKAILNKNKAKRQGKADPAEIATQIWAELTEKQGDFLRRYDPDFLDRTSPFDTFDIPAEGIPAAYEDMFISHGVRFLKGKRTQTAMLQTLNAAQDELIVLLASKGNRGLIRIPNEEKECRRVLNDYGRFVRKREETIRQMIEERTADEELQDKIYINLIPLLSGL
jgi:hypothetical protein